MIWGINIPVMKYGVSEVDPFVFNAIRQTISTVVLACCAWVERKNIDGKAANATTTSNQKADLDRPTGARLYLYVIAFGLLAGFAYQYIFLCGIFRTSSGNTAIIMSSVPMWTAGISFLLINERLQKLAWVGLMITLVGTIIVTLAKGDINSANATFTGNMLILLAAIAWSTASVVSRPILKLVTPIQLAFYATVLSLPLHWLVSLPNLSSDWSLAFAPLTAAAIVYSGLFSTGVAYAMWNFGVQQLGAAHASAYQNLVPLVALLGGWILISEVPTSIQIFGGVMIIGGLLVMRKSQVTILPNEALTERKTPNT